MWTAEKLNALADSHPRALVSIVLKLQSQIEALHARFALNSQNSSKPPSTDGFQKPAPKSLRKKSTRKSGGQLGHPGRTLVQVKNPDHVVIHPLEKCPCGCGRSLRRQPVLRYENRQVFDLPPQRLEVTEHRAEIKRCPVSGREVCAAFPSDVSAPTQYGPRFNAWLVYCRVQQLLPLDRIGQMANDLFGHPVSDATVQAALCVADKNLELYRDEVKRQLIRVDIAHADETGVRVMKSLHWLHVVSTRHLTWYGIHAKRGREAIDDFGILISFKGRLIHDCLSSYFKLSCAHGLCNSHILRELIFLHEQLHQTWAESLHDLLLEMRLFVGQRKHIASGCSTKELACWRKRYDAIVELGYAANPYTPPTRGERRRGRPKKSKARNLLDRLKLHAKSVLAFLYDFRVPFSNNQGEQDLRMMKVQQKISGSFRTLHGARAFANIRSYVSTARKNGQNVLDAIGRALSGHPFMPRAPT